MTPKKEFEKRNKELQYLLKDTKNRGLKEKYNRAISLTHAAEKTHDRLIKAAKNSADVFGTYTKDEQTSIDKELKRLSDEQETVSARIKKETASEDKARLEVKLKFLKFDILTVSVARAGSLALKKFDSDRRIGASENLEKTLIDRIIKPGESGFSKDAAIKAIELAVEAIPGWGLLISAINKLHDLSGRKRTHHAIADKHLSYLDDYCSSLEHWCVVAEMTISDLNVWIKAFDISD